jgi:hypothetical protein
MDYNVKHTSSRLKYDSFAKSLNEINVVEKVSAFTVTCRAIMEVLISVLHSSYYEINI